MPNGTARLTLLIDTHALIWIGEGNARVTQRVRDAIADPAAELLVSAVTAYEYADLYHRGRIPDRASFEAIQDALLFAVVDYPAELWSIAATLPPIHRDPVDRMMIAHAIHLEMPLISADEDVRRYPVEIVW